MVTIFQHWLYASQAKVLFSTISVIFEQQDQTMQTQNIAPTTNSLNNI